MMLFDDEMRKGGARACAADVNWDAAAILLVGNAGRFHIPACTFDNVSGKMYFYLINSYIGCLCNERSFFHF